MTPFCLSHSTPGREKEKKKKKKRGRTGRKIVRNSKRMATQRNDKKTNKQKKTKGKETCDILGVSVVLVEEVLKVFEGDLFFFAL